METQALALLLFVLAGSEIVNEPASPEDAAARRAYFDSLVRQSAIGPCKASFPKDAESFDRSYAKWSQDNASLVAQGEKSIREAARAMAGPDEAEEPFDVKEAEKAIAQVLRELPPEKRRPWCKQYF